MAGGEVDGGDAQDAFEGIGEAANPGKGLLLQEIGYSGLGRGSACQEVGNQSRIGVKFYSIIAGTDATSQISYGKPSCLALCRRRSSQAGSRAGNGSDRRIASGEVSEAAFVVRQGASTVVSLKPERVFILASISKPMTVTGVMTLVERGKLRLEDPVRKFIPEFKGGDRDLVTVRHLLTHTSGLPDMLPENVELRKRHAPIADFVAATCKTPLLFKPGTQVKYQSMGILLASAIAERISGLRFPDFQHQFVFAPAGMNATSLGLGGRQDRGHGAAATPRQRRLERQQRVLARTSARPGAAYIRPRLMWRDSWICSCIGTDAC